MELPGFKGFDLHRVIRYGYPGFLLVAIALLLAPAEIKPVLDAGGPVVAPLAIVAAGAVIYVFYRYFLQELFISPLILHPLHALLDHRRPIKTNPANYVGIKYRLRSPYVRHAAYMDIRRAFFDPTDRSMFDMSHTEATIVWTTAIEFFATALLLFTAQPAHIGRSIAWVFLGGGIMFFISAVAIDIRLFRQEWRVLTAYEARPNVSLRTFLEQRGYLEPAPSPAA